MKKANILKSKRAKHFGIALTLIIGIVTAISLGFITETTPNSITGAAISCTDPEDCKNKFREQVKKDAEENNIKIKEDEITIEKTTFGGSLDDGSRPLSFVQGSVSDTNGNKYLYYYQNGELSSVPVALAASDSTDSDRTSVSLRPDPDAGKSTDEDNDRVVVAPAPGESKSLDKQEEKTDEKVEDKTDEKTDPTQGGGADVQPRQPAQRGSQLTMFQKLDAALTHYSGLGQLSQFVFEEEDLEEWRETVDEQFATLYLGTEYWESEICSDYVDREADGVAYFETNIGLSGIAAHVEATRSPPIDAPPDLDLSGSEPEEANEQGIVFGGTGTSLGTFVYKITFNVRNGEDDKDRAAFETMRFNVILKGDREAELYADFVEVPKGEQFGAVGTDAIVQYSNNFYNQICLRFERVPTRWTTVEGNELCNEIPEVDATPTFLGDQEEEIGTTPTVEADPEKGIIIPI